MLNSQTILLLLRPIDKAYNHRIATIKSPFWRFLDH